MTDVSVIIPAYNPGSYLQTTLSSLIRQTHTAWEAVVVDDGSYEDLSWIDLIDSRVRRLRQANQGLSAARNAGIEATSAPFVAFLDADDIWCPEKLSRQLEQFRIRPELGLSSTAFVIIDEKGTVSGGGFEGHHDSYRALLGGNGVCVSTVMVPRAVLREVGVFVLDLQAAQDWDLWLRISQQYPIERVEMASAQYRIHPAGMSQDWRRTYRESLIVLHKHAEAAENGGFDHVRKLAAAQAFDAARHAWRQRNLYRLGCALAFVLRTDARVLVRALRERIVGSAGVAA